jgi:glycosyltransferase involved in cell wall biosynthesis
MLDKGKVLVISAVNITNGGPSVVLQDYINSLDTSYFVDKIFLVINSNTRIEKTNKTNIKYLIYNYPLKNFFFRLFFEYFHLFFLSLKLKSDYWISFNDITPFCISKKKSIYIHSPISFEIVKKQYIFQSPVLFLKLIFFRIIHYFTLNWNDHVIVQQFQSAKKISNLYKINNSKLLIINPKIPDIDFVSDTSNDIYTLFYPSIPRPLKNIHLVCEAIDNIIKTSNLKVQLKLTLDGNENSYSKKIFEKYKKNESVLFLGELTRDDVLKEMSKSDAVIFASEFETWGLPISEAIKLKKDLFIINLEYSKETAAGYNKIHLFDKDNLNDILKIAISNTKKYDFINPLINQSKITFHQFNCTFFN